MGYDHPTIMNGIHMGMAIIRLEIHVVIHMGIPSTCPSV